MTETVFEARELTLITAALNQLGSPARAHRLGGKAGALIARLGPPGGDTRPVRRFQRAELKLMRLAIFDGKGVASETRHLTDKLTRIVLAKQLEGLPENQVRWGSAMPYFAFNLAAVVGVFVFRPRWQDLALCLGLYFVRMFAVGGGLHRYFSHKSYSTSRAFQGVLAVLASTCGQQGPIWWAAAHRHHHRFSDLPEDFHSPSQRGFWWAHQLWAFTDRGQRTDLSTVKDLTRFPELRWLNDYWLVPHLVLVLILLVAGGLRAVEWGFFVSTVLLWQVSFTVNSLSHLVGSRRFETSDTSRNNWVLALLTLGDGWHNNHHYYPGSMRAGFYWWEIDVTSYIIRALSWGGLVWNIRTPPRHVLELGRLKRQPSTAALD